MFHSKCSPSGQPYAPCRRIELDIQCTTPTTDIAGSLKDIAGGLIGGGDSGGSLTDILPLGGLSAN